MKDSTAFDPDAEMPEAQPEAKDSEEGSDKSKEEGSDSKADESKDKKDGKLYDYQKSTANESLFGISQCFASEQSLYD